MSQAEKPRRRRFRSADGSVIVDGLIEMEFVGSTEKFRPACVCGWFGVAVDNATFAAINYRRHLRAAH